MEEGQLWRQYIIAAVANIGIAICGYTTAWSSPVLVKLADPEQSPLPEPITVEQEAWIGSLVTIGFSVGPLIGGFTASTIGRKWSILSCAIPLLIGWILLVTATDIAFLYAGRVVAGIGIGMLFSVSPMYCNEIATDTARGSLGSFLQLFVSAGILLVYCVGPYVFYSATAYIGMTLILVFCTAFFFMPESPIYSLINDDTEKAAVDLAWIRGKSRASTEEELNKMIDDVAASMKKTAAFSDVFRGNNLKAFSISCALMFFQQFSGSTAVLLYSTNIFIAAGSNLEPAIASIIVGVVQLGASLGTPFLANILTRRMLLMLSSCGSAISLGLLGMYFLLDDLESPIANIALAMCGFSTGWTSPATVILLDPELSPLPEPITVAQQSWVGSLLTIGAIFGPFMGGFAASKLGRKWGLLVSSVPLILGWTLVAIASNLNFLYAGRIICGLGVGMLFTIGPMYCAEIATDDRRGALGTYLQLFVSLGVLLVYSIGPFISYGAIAYVALALLSMFCVVFFFMPESPIYCLTKNDTEAAATNLAWIRGKSRDEVEEELKKMSANVTASMAKTATYADIFRGSNFKAFYISCTLLFFQQFSGVGAIVFYSTNIFTAAGSNIEPAYATIIVGSVRAVASLVTPFLVDSLGRRIMLLISSSGTAITLGLLGVYFFLNAQDSSIVPSISFLPILCITSFFITYSLGIGSIPWAILGEMLPIEVKTKASPIATAFHWLMVFFVTRYFAPVGEAAGMYVVFWIFGACCVMCFFFTLFFVPETKNKSFQEIQDILAGRSTKTEKV